MHKIPIKMTAKPVSMKEILPALPDEKIGNTNMRTWKLDFVILLQRLENFQWMMIIVQKNSY